MTHQTTGIRIYSALLFLTALQDIFLAYNMFFILDEENRPFIVRDQNNNIDYQLLDVYKPKQPRDSSQSLQDEKSSSSSDQSDDSEDD